MAHFSVKTPRSKAIHINFRNWPWCWLAHCYNNIGHLYNYILTGSEIPWECVLGSRVITESINSVDIARPCVVATQ